MPLSLQAKLLRVLQEREIQRVGSTETVKIDVRLIATTNVDLEEAVETKKFRQDLFYRLNVIPIKIPSLAKRREDIPVLAWHFLRVFNKLHGRKIERISEKAMHYLTSAPWQGNVRELENAVERAVIMCRGEQIELTDFFLTDTVPELSEPSTVRVSDLSQGDVLTIANLEKRHILQTLDFNDGHRAKTAEVLGISIRTLRNKLNEYRRTGENI